MGQNKRQAGAAAEERAAAFLQQMGMEILEKNFRCRRGEIDLVGRQSGYLVFIEVKYRTGARCGIPEEAVDWRKQLKICQTADYYRLVHRIGAQTPIRYDVVAIQEEEIRWYPDAFPHLYGRM